MLTGATLIVCGAEPYDIPERLAAARSSTAIASTDDLATADDWSATVPVLALAPLAGGALLTIAGREVPWAAARPMGLGRLVTLGVDVEAATVRGGLTLDDWRAVLGTGAQSAVGHRQHSAGWMDAPAATELQRQSELMSADHFVPPMGVALGLVGLAGLLGAGGLVLWRRSGGIARRRDMALLFGAAALPGFVIGMARPDQAAGRVVLAEHFAEAGRTRVVTWLEVTQEGTVSVPAGVVEASLDSIMRSGDPAPVVVTGGQDPSVDVPHRIFGSVIIQVEQWRDDAGVEDRLLLLPGGGSLLRLEGGVAANLPDTQPLSDRELLVLTDLAAQRANLQRIAVERAPESTYWLIHGARP